MRSIIIANSLREMGIPTVQFSTTYRQFYARIGYRRSRKSHQRQRAFFYLGEDERSAIIESAKIKAQWKELKRRNPGVLDIVWPNNLTAPVLAMASMTAEEIEAVIDAYHERQRREAIEDGQEIDQMPGFSLAQVEAKYNSYREAKVGIEGEEGLKAGTVRGDKTNLRLALGYADTSMSISDFGYQETEEVKLKMFKRVGKGLDRRTAVNYLRALHRMLKWAHRRKEIPYRLPEDLDALFEFRKFTTVNIARYDPDVLKKLLKPATDRQRLYVLLGLNCGYYPVDIGMMRVSELVEFEGLPAIARVREKTSHQNDFVAVHTLWAETHRLLLQERAPENEWGLMLLSENGSPLYRSTLETKSSVVAESYARLKRKSKVQLAFKQFRKIGSTEMQRIGGDEVRRLYKAGAIGHGDEVYVLANWTKLIAPLQQWGQELMRDGILTR